MYKLSSDPSFNFEILRMLAHSSYGGADISECLVAAGEIAPGDFESYYAAWNKRAERLISQAEGLTDPISVRETLFRAATYLRAADFYLHGNWDDHRIDSLWKKQVECFDRAISCLPIPGYRKLLPADGFQVPIIVFLASEDSSQKRPTILMCNGYDGAMEEIYHLHGIGALDRGYNLVVFEGPGQPTVRRSQNLGFNHEWEKVASPVIDYLETVPSVDMKKIGLLGYSMSGLLAARAAAFDPRISAVFAIDGLYDLASTPVFSNERGMGKFQDVKDFDSAKAIFEDPQVPTPTRWALSHGLWAFNVKSPAELLAKVPPFTLEGIADRIKCPVFVGLASEDMFFAGQPELMAAAIGDNATLVKFTDEDGAAEHCDMGASRYVNRMMYEWFEREVVKKAGAV